MSIHSLKELCAGEAWTLTKPSEFSFSSLDVVHYVKKNLECFLC